MSTERDGLNLRAKPDTAASIVTVIPRGATLTVYGIYEGWYAVGYGEAAGYVSARYVRL